MGFSFIPGWMPTGALRAPLTSITFVDHVEAAAASITAPSTVIAGDCLVLCDVAGPFGAAQTTVPSGFTLLTSHLINAGGGFAVTTSARITTDNDANRSLSGMNGGGYNFKKLWHFRGNSRILSVSAAQSVQFHETSADPNQANVNSDAGTVPLIAFGWGWSQSAVGGVTYPQSENTDISSDLRLAAGYDIQLVTPLDTTWDIDDGGSANGMLGYYVNFS